MTPPMLPQVTGFFDQATYTVSYIVADPKTKRAAILDSVLDYAPNSGRISTASADRILKHIHEQGLKVEWILETHAHADHLSAAPYLQERLGVPIGIGEHIRRVQTFFKSFYNIEAAFPTDGSQFGHLFKDGETFRIGELEARVLYTPGHTPACVTYVTGDAAFVGDTLFMPDYGTARADFPGGDARTLHRSIQRLFKELPPETRVFLCHDYGAPDRKAYIWETTLAEERAKNIHVHEGVSEDAFVKMRTERDKTLDLPVLMLPSLQVNIRAGHLPPTESNGVAYLKIPLNAI
ncbi:MAG: MBL fold metallo-hydrolase [Pseudomonadota bacterium]